MLQSIDADLNFGSSLLADMSSNLKVSLGGETMQGIIWVTALLEA